MPLRAFGKQNNAPKDTSSPSAVKATAAAQITAPTRRAFGTKSPVATPAPGNNDGEYTASDVMKTTGKALGGAVNTANAITTDLLAGAINFFNPGVKANTQPSLSQRINQPVANSKRTATPAAPTMPTTPQNQGLLQSNLGQAYGVIQSGGQQTKQNLGGDLFTQPELEMMKGMHAARKSGDTKIADVLRKDLTRFQAGQNAKNNKLGFLDAMNENGVLEAIPFLGSADQASKLYLLWEAAKATESGTADPYQKQLLQEYVEYNGRDRSFMYNVGRILKMTPAFVGEFALTSGFYSAGKKAAQETAEAAVKTVVKKSIENTLASKVIGAVGGSLLRTVAQPARVAEERFRSGLNEYKFSIDDEGKINSVLENDKDGFVEAWGKAFGSQYIENISELSGGILDEIPLPAKVKGMKAAVIKKWFEMFPKGTATELTDKITKAAGWNGIIGEMFEERVGAAMRKFSGIDPKAEIIPDAEQLLTEGVAFSFVGAGLNVPAQVVNKMQAHETAKQEKAWNTEQESAAKRSGLVNETKAFIAEDRAKAQQAAVPELTIKELERTGGDQRVGKDLIQELEDLARKPTAESLTRARAIRDIFTNSPDEAMRNNAAQATFVINMLDNVIGNAETTPVEAKGTPRVFVPDSKNEPAKPSQGGISSVGQATSQPSLRDQAEAANIMPTLTPATGGKTATVTSFGKTADVPLVQEYKGKQIVMTGDSYSVWDPKEQNLFVVALDDSKMSGSRKLKDETNNVEGAKKYIDWLTKDKPASVQEFFPEPEYADVAEAPIEWDPETPSAAISIDENSETGEQLFNHIKLNPNLPIEEQKKSLKHEIEHIRQMMNGEKMTPDIDKKAFRAWAGSWDGHVAWLEIKKEDPNATEDEIFQKLQFAFYEQKPQEVAARAAAETKKPEPEIVYDNGVAFVSIKRIKEQALNNARSEESIAYEVTIRGEYDNLPIMVSAKKESAIIYADNIKDAKAKPDITPKSESKTGDTSETQVSPQAAKPPSFTDKVQNKLKSDTLNPTEQPIKTEAVNDNPNPAGNDQVNAGSGELSAPDKMEPGQPGESSGDVSQPGGQAVRREPSQRDANAGKRSAVDQVALNKQIEDLVASKDTFTPEEKDLISQYTGAGGLEKGGASGKGLLDEYYTPTIVAEKMWQLIAKYMDISKPMEVLEPSIGTGNMLSGAPLDIDLTGYEVNPASAKIARSVLESKFKRVTVIDSPFEVNFIDQRGNKKVPYSSYSVVIGNPPYGDHRGYSKGLGEEPAINRYEEYFVKRGLDMLKEGGILAYVMPSRFLQSAENKAKHLIYDKGELLTAYRLPNGVFGTTDIGTDIVLFKKATTGRVSPLSMLSNDVYFKNNPFNILGEQYEGTGRFGVETKVRGDISNVENWEITEQEYQDQKDKGVEATPDDGDVEPREGAAEEIKQAAKPTAPRVKVQKEVTITMPKKPTMTLDQPKGDMSLWNATTVTGELEGNFDKAKANLYQGKYYNDFNYYQGDIYAKLDQLEKEKEQLSTAQYTRQKEGLRLSLPVASTIDEVRIVPHSDFAAETTLANGYSLQEDFIRWTQDVPYEAFEPSSGWEVRAYAKGESVRGREKELNAEIRKRRRKVGDLMFMRYIKEELSAEEQANILDKFNRFYNSYHKPDYQEVPITARISKTFKKNLPLTVRPHQLEAIGFLVNKGSGLIAHDVGFGKTLSAIIAINEVMHKGWTKRPLIIVPNGTYANWLSEIEALLPGMKVNSLVNLGSKFKGNLDTLEIQDGTLSIITYEGMKKLGFTKETYDQLAADFSDVVTDSVLQGLKPKTERQGESDEAKIDEVVGRAAKGTMERTVESLGFDHVTFDELHNFKNIFVAAKMEKDGEKTGKANEYRNVQGSSSDRGVKAYMLSQYIMNKYNNRNVFGLSATPFTNTPMEIYSILSLFGKKRLKEMGLHNVNTFMSAFMDITPTFVVKADQQVLEQDVIEKFLNLQQLQRLVGEFIDFRSGETEGLVRPEKAKKKIMLNPTQLQMDYIAQAQDLFIKDEENPGGTIVAITELKKIALSPYLSRYYPTDQPINYEEFVENSPKINFTMKAIAQVKKDNPKVGQVIYMDAGIEQYPLLKEYLIKKLKYKDSEIGIVRGGMSIDAKQKVQDAFNAGTIKILIGSSTIKEGINLQENSTELYYLYLPWNPTELIQVEGRIWRNGNQWKNVRINYPLVENTIDSFLFQKLETKEKRIKNIWSYTGNEVEVGDLDFEELKLDLITDPLIKAKAEATFEKAKQENKLNTLKAEVAFKGRKITNVLNAEKRVKGYEGQLADTKALIDSGELQPDTYRLTSTERYLKDAQESLQKEMKYVTGDLAEMKKEIDVMNLQVTEQEAHVKSLDEIFKAKIAQATEESVMQVATPTDYQSIIDAIKEENKTFFVKRDPRMTASYAGQKIGLFESREKVKEGEFKIFEKVQELSKKYATTLGEGKGLPNKAAGVVYWDTGNLRMKGINNLSVAAHELAHSLDRKFKITDNFMEVKGRNVNGNPIYAKETAALRKELTDLYMTYYTGARKEEKLETRMKEGFASLIQKYVEMPTTIKQEYPNLVTTILEPGGEYYRPVIGEILKDLGDIIAEYQGLNALDKIGARITSKKTGINKGSFLTLGQKIRTFMFDDVYPAEVLAQKSGTWMTKEDPSLWMRFYKNHNSVTAHNIVGKKDYYGYRDGEFKIVAAENWNSLVSLLHQEKQLDSFGYYLVARDQHYQYQELDQLEARMNEKEDVIGMLSVQLKRDGITDEKQILEALSALVNPDSGLSPVEELRLAEQEFKHLQQILDKNGMTRQEVDDAFIQNRDRFLKESQVFDLLVHEDLKFAADPDVGLVKQSVFEELSGKSGYAPMKRQFYDEIVGDHDEAPGAVKVGKTNLSSMLSRTGGEQTIINPLYSAIRNHTEVVKKCIQQIIYNKVGQLAETGDFPTLFQVVPLKSYKDKDSGKIIYPQEKDKAYLMTRRNDKRIPILIDSEVRRVVDDVLTFDSISIWAKMAMTVSKIFTIGTTALFAPFAVTNMMQDQITAGVNSTNKFIPFVSPIRNIISVMLKTDPIRYKNFIDYMNLVGDRQTYFGWMNLAPDDMMQKMTHEKVGLEKAAAVIEKGIDIAGFPSNMSEIMTRAAEYDAAIKAGHTQMAAIEMTARVSGSFSHTGSWRFGKFKSGKNAIKSIAFANPGFQILDGHLRTAQGGGGNGQPPRGNILGWESTGFGKNRRWKMTSGGKRIYLTIMAMIAAYLASLAVMAQMASDEQKQQYRDLFVEDLTKYIYFPKLGGHGLIRIRISESFSGIASVINMVVAEQIFGAKYSTKEYINASTQFMPQQLNPLQTSKWVLSWFPTVANPPSSLLFNVRTYPEVRPLEGESMKNLPPGMRYNEGTSAFAKFLGKTMNLSPVKTDALLTGYLGRSVGYLTGTPYVYKLDASVNRDYYFTTGRSVAYMYDTVDKINQDYSAYQGGKKDLSSEEAMELYRKKQIANEFTKQMSDFRDLDIEKVTDEKVAAARNKILSLINMVDTGDKLPGFGEAVQTYRKNRRTKMSDK